MRISKVHDELVKIKNLAPAKNALPREELLSNKKIVEALKQVVKKAKKEGTIDPEASLIIESLEKTHEAIRLAGLTDNEFKALLAKTTTRARKDVIATSRRVGQGIIKNTATERPLLLKNLRLTAYERRTMFRYHTLKDRASFKNFRTRLEAQTRNMNIISGHSSKSQAFLSLGVAHGAIRQRTNNLMVHATEGFITDKVAKGINNILSNRWNRLGTKADEAIIKPDVAFVDATKDAFEGLQRLGMPITRDSVRATLEGGAEIKKSLRLVKTGESRVGKSIYMIRAQVDELDKKMPKIVKELSKHYVDETGRLERLLMDPLDKGLQWWKQSIVTGIIFPRPDFWVTNFVGDVGQIYTDLGLLTSGKVALNTFPEQIPFFGKAFSEKRADLVKGIKGPALAGAVSSILDPLSGGILRGDKGFFRNRFGVQIPYEEAARTALELGIFDTMVHAEFLNQFTRLTPAWYQDLAAGAKGFENLISNFANYTQSRMRFNLYLELLRQGDAPKQAAKKVKSALYDWKHGLAQGEVKWIARLIPFWRFWRLAWKQTAGAFLDPLIKPQGVLKKAMAGDTRLARTRNTVYFKDQLPFLLDPEIADAYDADGKQYDHMARYLRPEWARNRPLATLTRNSRERIEFFRQARGTEYNPTHNMVLAPPLTQVDALEFLLLAPKAMFVLGASSGVIPEYDLAPDWEASFWRPTLDMINPAYKEPLEALLLSMGRQTGGFGSGEWTSLSEWEFQAQRGVHAASRGMFMETRRHPETGKPQGRPLDTLLHRTVPVAGVELTRLMNPLWYENPGRVDGPMAGFAYFAGNYSGLYKQRPFDPRRNHFYHNKMLDRHITKAYREAGGDRWYGYSEGDWTGLDKPPEAGEYERVWPAREEDE